MNYQSIQRDDDMLDIGDETMHASTQEDTSTYNNDLGELHQGIGQDLKRAHKPDFHIYRLRRTNHYV
jgi:hypothetical protein